MKVLEVSMNDSIFNNFDQTFSTFNIIFIIVSIVIAIVFLFTILSIISPKFRGKMMSRQIRATKHMVDYSKEDLENIGTNLGNTAIKININILDENEEDLKKMANKKASIKKDYVKTMASAIHEGFKEDDTIYCKHCGSMIDSDSTFCKICGKKQ